MNLPQLRVVAAVLFDAQRRVLIAQRPPGKPLAGYWEFPGGKLLAGEDEVNALRRELVEELGIEMQSSRPLLSLTHDYPDRRVQLAVRVVERYDGVPRGVEGQPLKWVSPDGLFDENLLPADKPIVEALLRESSAR